MSDRKSVWSMIAIPAAITLAITVLRLVGELEHWPAPWFNNAAGGGGAVVGISWLPIFFGPWFALKLARAGEAPSGMGKAIGFAILSVAVLVGAGFWAGKLSQNLTNLLLIPFALMLVAAFIPGIGWSSLSKTLLAYAFAARVPVLVVMYLALAANGGQGWGTHYDAVDPRLTNFSLGRKFFYEAFVPQMTLWIGFTVGVGALLGSVAAAVARLGKRAAPAGA
jgi:hypothetical protein